MNQFMFIENDSACKLEILVLPNGGGLAEDIHVLAAMSYVILFAATFHCCFLIFCTASHQ